MEIKQGTYGQIAFGEYLAMPCFSRTWAKHWLERRSVQYADSESIVGDQYADHFRFGHYFEACIHERTPAPAGHMFSRLNKCTTIKERQILASEMEAMGVKVDGDRLPLSSLCAILKETKGLAVVFVEEAQMAEAMLEVFFKKPGALSLLEGRVEYQSTFVGEIAGTPAKIRPDFINHDKRLLVDVKTTKDASLSAKAFPTDSAKFGYFEQAAMYSSVYSQVTGEYYEWRNLVFQKGKVIDCAFYGMPEKVMAKAMENVTEAATAYKSSRELVERPGYPDKLQTLFPPSWWWGKGGAHE